MLAKNIHKIVHSSKASSLSLYPTRRQFIFGAASAGALTLLGSVATKNGMLIAFADEIGNTSFELIVIGRGDLAILAIDPSNNTILPNMNISITSYAENAQEQALNVTTNEKGIAVVNARALSENWSEESPDSGYGFWAKVEATKDGYRDYATSQVRIQTGPGPQSDTGGRQANLTIPSQTYNKTSDFGYVRTLAFDNFDIQYFTSSFCACSGNKAEHTLSLELIASPSKAVSASFVYDGSELASTTGTTDANGRAWLEMKGTWLSNIEANKTAQVFFVIDGAKYEAPCKLKFIPAADGITNMQTKEDATCSLNDDANPILDGANNLSVYKILLPEKFPVWGGTYVNLPLPDFPIMLTIDPTGTIQAGISINLLPSIPGLKGNKLIGNSNWEYMRAETWSDMRERQINSECAGIQRYQNAKYIKQGGSKQGNQTTFGGQIVLTFEFDLVLQGNWSWDNRTWAGGLNAILIIGGKYELGTVFLVGPFPFYVGFDVALMLTSSLYIGWQAQSGFKKFGWNPDKEGLTLVPRIEVGVSFGAGIHGYLSAGVRGYGYFQTTFGFVATNKAFPHVLIEANMILTAVVQIMCASFTVSVWHWCDESKIIHDNWDENSALNNPEAAQIPKAFRNSRATYIIDDNSTIDISNFNPALLTTSDLLSVCEFTGSANEVTEDGTRDLEMHPSFKQPSYDAPNVSGFGIVPSGNLLGSSQYDASLGTICAVDECIYEGVFSDSRQKVIKTKSGELYLFRLCIVDVNSLNASNGETYIKFNKDTGLFEEQEVPLTEDEINETFSVPRSRISMAKLGSNGKWGEPRVVDFYIKNESQVRFRLNCNDYDFAVCEKPDEEGVFFLNVCSSQIQETSLDTFEVRWKNQFITMFKFDSNKTGKEALIVGKVLNPEDNIVRYCPFVNYHSLSGQVFFSFVTAKIDGESASYELNTNIYAHDALSWAYPIASNARSAFNGEATAFYQSFKAEKGSMWSDANTKFTGISWVGNTLNTQNSYQVYFQAYNTTSKSLLPGVVFTYDNSAEPILVPERGWIVVSLDENNTASSKRRELTFCDLNPQNWMIASRKVGIANMTSFTPSSDGSRLFAVHTIHGENAETQNFQIYAADWDSAHNTYHTFYPFCQTTHPLDQVQSAVVGSGYASFISTEITNAEAGRADIHQMNVPLVASVQLVSATCMDEFAGVGDVVKASVCVQNNGNLPLSAFTVTLYDNEEGTGEPLATKRFDNLVDEVCPNVLNYQGEDENGDAIYMPDEAWLAKQNASGNATYGNFTEKDLDALFWPGDERSFASIEFSIPAIWENKGNVKVYAFVSNAEADITRLSDIRNAAAPNFSGDASADARSVAAAVANTSVLDASVGFGATTAGSVEPDSLGVFHDADIMPESFELNLEAYAAKDEYVSEANYVAINEEVKAAGGHTQKLADTSDNMGKLAGPLAVLGAGAAALSAYSKRRAENDAENKGSHIK